MNTNVRFAGATVLTAALLLSGCSSGGDAKAPAEPQGQEAGAEPVARASAPADEAPAGEAAGVAGEAPAGAAAGDDEIQIVTDIVDGYKFRRIYAVAPNVKDDAALVDLMKRLHEKEPKAWWWLFDSDEKAEVLAKALPKTMENDFSEYPGTWVEEHTIGHLVLTISPTDPKRYWSVYRGPYTEKELATFPYNGEYG